MQDRARLPVRPVAVSAIDAHTRLTTPSPLFKTDMFKIDITHKNKLQKDIRPSARVGLRRICLFLLHSHISEFCSCDTPLKNLLRGPTKA